MADPTVTQLVASTSTTATTTVSFTAQAANTLLLLWVGSDNYRATSGSGRPESTSWSALQGGESNLGFYLWYKITDGSDSSVQYTLTPGAAKSTHAVTAVTNIDPASPVDVSAVNIGTLGSWTSGTSPSSGTTSAGRRIAFGGLGLPTNSAISGVSAWTNSYTEIHDAGTTSGYRDWMGVAYLIFDGGGTTSTGATYNASVDQTIGITAVFKVASGGTQYSVSGSVATASAVSGTVQARLSASGSAPAVTTAAGSITSQQGVTGAVAATAAASGSPTSRQGVTGAVAAITASSGAVSLRQQIASEADSVSSSAGAVTALLAAASTVPIVSTVAGVVTIAGGLDAAGAVAVQSGVSGAVSALLAVSGTAPATSTAAGSATLLRPVTGAVAVVSGTAGSVDTTAPVRVDIKITGVTEPVTGWQTTDLVDAWAATDATSGWAPGDTSSGWLTTDPSANAGWLNGEPAVAAAATAPAFALTTTEPTI